MNLGFLSTFQGLPTYVSGYNEDEDVDGDTNTLFQYHWDEDKWTPHPTITVAHPRHLAAVFQVPKDILGIC